jgi:hypothetical protein
LSFVLLLVTIKTFLSVVVLSKNHLGIFLLRVRVQ